MICLRIMLVAAHCCLHHQLQKQRLPTSPNLLKATVLLLSCAKIFIRYRSRTYELEDCCHFFAKECIIGALWMDKRHLSGCLFVPLVDFLLPFGLASSCRWSVTSNPLFHTVSFHKITFESFDLCQKYIGIFPHFLQMGSIGFQSHRLRNK